VRTLEGTMLAWSPGTGGRPLEAPVIATATFAAPEEFEAWLATVRGKYVAISRPQDSCRPISRFEQFGQTGAADRIRELRGQPAQRTFAANKPNASNLRLRLEEAGAVQLVERCGCEQGIRHEHTHHPDHRSEL
jgi:hypothetical protein